MKEICAYTGRNEGIIHKWIEKERFPAAFIDGRWESNTTLIDAWQLQRIKRLTNFQDSENI